MNWPGGPVRIFQSIVTRTLPGPYTNGTRMYSTTHFGRRPFAFISVYSVTSSGRPLTAIQAVSPAMTRRSSSSVSRSCSLQPTLSRFILHSSMM